MTKLPLKEIVKNVLKDHDEEGLDDDSSWIINKVLDAVEEQGKHHIEYILAHTSDDSMTRRIGIDVIYDYIGNINKLRP